MLSRTLDTKSHLEAPLLVSFMQHKGVPWPPCSASSPCSLCWPSWSRCCSADRRLPCPSGWALWRARPIDGVWSDCWSGLTAAVTSTQSGALGRGVLLAGPLFGLCLLLGVVAGELRVMAPAGARRSAALEVRSGRDYVPRRLTAAVGGATALLIGLLAFTGAIGSADDLGRAGRSLTRACSDVSGQSRGPWPGSFYAWPLAAVVLVGVVVAGVALVSVTRRPRQGEASSLDDALRRQVSTGVIAAVGLIVTVPLVGVGTFAASGLLRICAAPTTWTVVGTLLLAVVPLALVLGVWCAAVLVMYGRVRPAEAARS